MRAGRRTTSCIHYVLEETPTSSTLWWCHPSSWGPVLSEARGFTWTSFPRGPSPLSWLNLCPIPGTGSLNLPCWAKSQLSTSLSSELEFSAWGSNLKQNVVLPGIPLWPPSWHSFPLGLPSALVDLPYSVHFHFTLVELFWNISPIRLEAWGRLRPCLPHSNWLLFYIGLLVWESKVKFLLGYKLHDDRDLACHVRYFTSKIQYVVGTP